MGVSGCGKSTLAQAVAQALGCTMLEGDAFHADASQAKMSQGIPLTDADRTGWLATLGDELTKHPEGVVLSCSALKQAYRDTLRNTVPQLHFVFLEISHATALARVSARARAHFLTARASHPICRAVGPAQRVRPGGGVAQLVRARES